MIEEYRQPGALGDSLITIAIGDVYLSEWEKYAKPTWQNYCERHDLGLYAVTADLLERDNPLWKKATWQKMLLGNRMKTTFPNVQNLCYLDTDILISPSAPNIFGAYDESKIGMVSQVKNVPQPIEETKRLIAFLRHSHYDTRYPLDSALFMSPQDIFNDMGKQPFDDYGCAGLILLNVNNHGDLMESWFEKYRSDDSSVTGGDEPHFNYEVQNHGEICWLDYKFQALWTYEMAWKYPFLYAQYRDDKDITRSCIEASLTTNYFLHFAGSWHESDMWVIDGLFDDQTRRDAISDYQLYLQQPVSGKPVGQVKPS